MAVAVLPILEFEDKILETVENNSVVVVIGETGSGKSTQLPQILHRKGYTKSGVIAVTQPRRVAAVSVARRVAQELNVQLGEEVGYAIRFEDRTNEKKTKVKYLTDGVLLRESLSDPELKQYSVIILDEAHERSLNTDILLGLFFSNCPVLTVPGKLFPVEIVYSSERPTSYLDACLNKALDIHIHQPPGDVLIFMTGQDDIDKCVKKLEEGIQSLEAGCCMDALILPLHGSLPPEMQMRVFSPPPQNCRRFIVATNIAETSLTVDGVQDYKNLRMALSVGYASQLAERMIYHNGYKTLGFRQQLVKVHPSSVLKPEEDGMLPNYVVYHELIATSRPFMRSVCAVEVSWVEPILQKLKKVDVNKLSGGFATPEDTLQGHCVSDLPKKEADDCSSKILAARERYLARQWKKKKVGGPRKVLL
ncbi:hypothetical protein MKW92_019239 [Papaver armeniacum]|nr:hypothetical protein MKW92_019239 [Papaver armeniacum]